MLNFEFLEKGLGLVTPPYYIYDFLTKWFPCYILLTDQISLSDSLEIVDNICVVIISFSVDDVVSFEINLFFKINQK